MDLSGIAFGWHGECEQLTDGILHLSEAERRARRLQFAPGDCIWGPESLPRHVYMLTSGTVEISTVDVKGRETSLERVEPGQVFGYLCFCGHRREAVGTLARACVRSVAMRTTYDGFARALKLDAQLPALLAATLCARAAEAQARVQVLVERDAERRLLLLLLQMAENKAQRLGSQADEIGLHVSHAQLAAAACLTRTHVTTLMTRLRQRRLLRYERGSAVTLGMERLRRALEPRSR